MARPTRHRVRTCPACGHDCGGNPSAYRCPECGEVVPTVTAGSDSDGHRAAFVAGLETLWRVAVASTLVGTCAGTGQGSVFMGVLLLILGGFRSLAWWRIEREGWFNHPALTAWHAWVRTLCIAELCAAAAVVLTSILVAGPGWGNHLVAAAKTASILALGLQAITLQRVIRDLWRRLLLPPPEWFDDLAFPALVIGAIGLVQTPVVLAVATVLPAAIGDRVTTLAMVLDGIGFLAMGLSMIVVVDRGSRINQASGFTGGLDPPPDPGPDWDGTRRPRSAPEPTAPTAPRIVRRATDDDPIPME